MYLVSFTKMLDLAVLGPIFVLKLKWQPRDYARKMVAELWLYPSGDRIFELSTKCLPSETFQVATETRVYLSEHGIDLLRRAADQDTHRARVRLGRARGELITSAELRRQPVHPDGSGAG